MLAFPTILLPLLIVSYTFFANSFIGSFYRFFKLKLLNDFNAKYQSSLSIHFPLACTVKVSEQHTVNYIE